MSTKKSDYEVARDFALFLNAHPSDEEQKAWLKASPVYRGHRLKFWIYLLMLIGFCSAVAWMLPFRHDKAEQALCILGMAISALLTLFAVIDSLAELRSVSYWARPLGSDTALCARFLTLVDERASRVIAQDRALHRVDLEVARLSIAEEERQEQLAVCATAHSMVKTAPASNNTSPESP